MATFAECCNGFDFAENVERLTSWISIGRRSSGAGSVDD